MIILILLLMLQYNLAWSFSVFLLAPFFDDSMVDLLYAMFWDPLCWFLVPTGHLLNVLDVLFDFILVDALIIFAIFVIDMCGLWFISSGDICPLVSLLCSESRFMRIYVRM